MRSQEFIDLLSLGFINVKTISDENLEAELSKGKGIIFYTFDENNGNVVKCHAFFMKMPFDSWDSTLFLCSEYDNPCTVKGYRFESGEIPNILWCISRFRREHNYNSKFYVEVKE